MKRLRQILARRRLQRIVMQSRNSYATQRYREPRAAALKGLSRSVNGGVDTHVAHGS